MEPSIPYCTVTVYSPTPLCTQSCPLTPLTTMWNPFTPTYDPSTPISPTGIHYNHVEPLSDCLCLHTPPYPVPPTVTMQTCSMAACDPSTVCPIVPNLPTSTSGWCGNHDVQVFSTCTLLLPHTDLLTACLCFGWCSCILRRVT